MKKTLLMGLLSLSGAVCFTGCSSETPVNPTGTGQIIPAVDLNSEIIASRTSSRASGSDITVNDLAIKLTATDGSYSHSWPSVADFPADQPFAIGDYLIEASYGSLDDEGFDKPFYYASQQISVQENKETAVSLTATLANAMVSVTYTDAFRNYMTDWSAEVHAAGGSYIDIAADETRPAYIRPGNAILNVTVTKPNGLGATLEVATFAAQARHHYHITVDVNNGQTGDAVLVVSFDETLDNETVEIELSDELLAAPAPEISAEGWNGSDAVSIVEGSSAGPLKFNIVSHAGLGAVTMTTSSPSLVEKGWPVEVDLVSASDADRSRLTSLGFKALGLWNNPDKMAVADLTEAVRNITYSEARSQANTFTFVVKDRLGRVSEPVTLTVNVDRILLALSNPSTIYDGTTTLSCDLAFNGADAASSVKIQIKNARGMWDDATVTSITPAGNDLNRVTLTVPADNSDVVLRAVCGAKISPDLKVERAAAPFTVTCNPNDVFATRATASLASTGVDAATRAARGKLYISADGGATYTEATAQLSGAVYTFTGLTPATAYSLRFTDEGINSPVTTFTTEAALTVPNGDFEDLTETLRVTDTPESGQWSISAGINYQNTLTYTVSEPTGWASVNNKTASPAAANQNSWFVVPSAFSTKSTFIGQYPTVMTYARNEDTPDSYKGFTAQHGENAMVVRNVAWDANGTTPARWLKTFSTEYYNHNVPTVANRSAGKLFLGSYSYSGGNENYNEGVSFASRPSSLTGYYRYTRSAADGSETGVVTVTLLNGNTVVGTGTATLQPAGDYTQFNVPVTYGAGAAKATSLRIMFASSNHASYNQAEETAAIKTDNKLNRYEAYSLGATLAVDNLTFNY